VDAYLRAWVDGPGRGGPAPTEVRGQCRDMAYMTLVRHAAATGAAHGVGAQRHLSEIACPVETVFGEYDATDVRDMAERLARAVPGTSVHAVDRAGHLVNLDQPARFAQLLTGFLARTTGSAA